MNVKNVLDWLRVKKDQVIFVVAIIVVAIVILIYNSISNKRSSADSQVSFIQGFYALQFGDTLNAPKLLMDVYSRNKSNFVGFWAGLTLADYYYKLEKKENVISIIKNIRPSDKIGESAKKLLDANLRADMGNVKDAISKLNTKTGFGSIDNYILYRKAKLLMARGELNEAIKILKELSKKEGPFSELAKQELKTLGQKI